MKAFQNIFLQLVVLVAILNSSLQANEAVTTTAEISSTYNVTGGGQLCKDTGVSIVLDGSDFGEDYYLKKDGTTDTNSRKKGTGLALSWDGITATGSYTIVRGLSPEAAQTGSVSVTTGPQLAKPDVDDELYYVGDGKILTNQVLTITQRGSETYKWYDLDGNEIGTGLTYTIDDFIYSEPVTVIAKAFSGACESDAKTVRAYVSHAILPTSITHTITENLVYLSASGTPATDIKWYWQGTDSLGTSMAVDASIHNLRITQNRTYYLRAFDADKRIWGHSSKGYAMAAIANASVTPSTNTNLVAAGVETKPPAYTSGTVYNLVRAYDVMQAGMTDTNIKSASADPANVTLSTQYADGLGRPLQVVSRKATPDEKDAVQAMTYDAFGRNTLQYLPFKSTTTNGALKTSPFTEQETFYDGRHLNDQQQSTEDIFYNKTVFEGSPLNRANMTMAAGDAWGGSAVGMKADYDFNTKDDSVRIWYLDGSGIPESKDLDEYKPSSLALSITTDEEGNKTRQFTNKLGQVVLKQVQLADSVGRGYHGYLNTYYVYDNYGNLRYVAPPKAVDILLAADWTWTPANLDELVFKYTYDNRGRMVSKKVPGAGTVNMVYDKLDRLVLTQDAVQAAMTTPQWTFTKYDDLGRPAMTGLYNTSATQSSLQTTLDTWNKDWGTKTAAPDTDGVIEGQTITVSSHISGTTEYHAVDEVTILPGFETDEATESRLGGALSTDYTVFMGYYDATFPLMKTENLEVLTVNYYDNYDFTSKTFTAVTPGWNAAGGSLNAVTPSQYPHVMGLATGSLVKVLGTTDQYLSTVMFYDNRGRVIQTQGDNHLNGTDVTSMQYDFSGKVLMSYTQHNNPLDATNGSTSILKSFVYDKGGRLLSVEQKLNDTGSFKRLVTNTYDDLGQLESKKLGDATTPLETLNYDYNIRGWLNGINSDYAKGTGADNAHFFGMTLDYVDDFSKNYRDGNIAGTIWRTPSSSKRKAYGYRYDLANRLTNGDYKQTEIIGGWSSNISDFRTSYTYDANGNITSLDRWGVVAGNTTLIDDLTYGYASNSNQLSYVQDVKGDMGQGDFRGDNTTTVDFAYDVNGNMNQDLTKDINAGDITYNHLNLPVSIEFDNNTSKTISYTYDAAGIKLQKKVNDGGVITTTDYVGGFIYQNNQLQQFGHEEGRVRLSGSNLVYDYYITDHLGNTRMTLTEEVSVTEYRATMETEYETPEEQLFLNMDDSRVVNGAANTTSGGNEVSRLNGYYADKRVGPGKVISVSPGDQVDLAVDAYYSGSFGSANPLTEADMTTAVAAAFGGLLGAPTGSESSAIYNLFDDPNYAVLVGSGVTDSGEPRAYLNYIFFDQDFNFISAKSGFKQISSLAGDDAVPEPLSASVSIDRGGFLYVYVSNETIVDFDVYFDELKITHTKGSILQEDHYYPFGLNISALSSTAPLSKPNDYNTFQEQERTKDFDLDWIEFKWRYHDPQIGRFISVDPLAMSYVYNSPYAFSENRVINGIELEGLEYLHFTVYLDSKGHFTHREVTHDYRYQDDFDYEEYSESFGPRGRGVLYTTKQDDGSGNYEVIGETMWHDQESYRNRVVRHGIFTGEGAVTKRGPEAKNVPKDDKYDFSLSPIDLVDAIARLHDMEQALGDFNSYKETRWIFSDIRILRRVSMYLNQINQGTLVIDPYTGRPPSSEARQTARKARAFFTLEIAKKRSRLAYELSSGQISQEEYNEYLLQINIAFSEPIQLPSNENNTNQGGN